MAARYSVAVMALADGTRKALPALGCALTSSGWLTGSGEISAFATVGLSRGMTSSLSDMGKLVMIVSMFIGRVGSLTLTVALTQPVATTAYEYPTETVMVG